MKPITRPAKTSLRGMSASSGDGPALRVSVVIPTHNRAELVGRAISSVLNQTFRDFELIVVDDGSGDNTVDVVAAISDPRLRFVRLATSGGASRARNAGIASARGEWVAFLDDDDEWLPAKLELQLARADSSADPRTSAVYCLQAELKEDGRLEPVPYRLPLAEGDVLGSTLALRRMVTPSIHMIKRSALFEVGGFDESFEAAEDRDLWLRLAQASHHFVVVPEVLITTHTSHRGRMTGNAVGLSRGLVRYERRWRTLARKHLSAERRHEVAQVRRGRMERLHRKHLKRLVRRGRRADAWRYVRAMTPTLRTFPWGAPFVARALAVVAFGRARPPRRSAENKAYQALRSERALDDAT